MKIKTNQTEPLHKNRGAKPEICGSTVWGPSHTRYTFGKKDHGRRVPVAEIDARFAQCTLHILNTALYTAHLAHCAAQNAHIVLHTKYSALYREDTVCNAQAAGISLFTQPP